MSKEKPNYQIEENKKENEMAYPNISQSEMSNIPARGGSYGLEKYGLSNLADTFGLKNIFQPRIYENALDFQKNGNTLWGGTYANADGSTTQIDSAFGQAAGLGMDIWGQIEAGKSREDLKEAAERTYALQSDFGYKALAQKQMKLNEHQNSKSKYLAIKDNMSGGDKYGSGDYSAFNQTHTQVDQYGNKLDGPTVTGVDGKSYSMNTESTPDSAFSTMVQPAANNAAQESLAQVTPVPRNKKKVIKRAGMSNVNNDPQPNTKTT